MITVEKTLFPLLMILLLLVSAGCRQEVATPEPTETVAVDELGGITPDAQAGEEVTTTATATTAARPTETDLTTAPTATPDTPVPTSTGTAVPAADTSTPVPPTPSPTACGAPTGWVEYTVQAGDTLSRLAQATGTSTADIQLANCLEDTTIFTGNSLFLPTLPPTATPTATASPVPPPALVVNGSQPQGSGPWSATLTYDDDYLLRIDDARHQNATDEPNGGIERVEFNISRNGVDVYEHTEGTPGYCIFGGGEPNCNLWPMEDGSYRWGAGGPVVEPGQYFGTAVFYFTPELAAESGFESGFWSFDIEIVEP